MQRLLNTIQAAPFCGVEPKTLENWRTLGKGPRFLRVHGRVAYDPQDIRSWLDARRVSSTSEAVAA